MASHASAGHPNMVSPQTVWLYAEPESDGTYGKDHSSRHSQAASGVSGNGGGGNEGDCDNVKGGRGGGDVGGSTSALTSQGRSAAPGFEASPAANASGHPLMPPSTKQNVKSGVSELCAPHPQIGAASPPLVQFETLEQLQPPSVGIGSTTGFAGGGGDGGAHGDADGGGDGDVDGGTVGGAEANTGGDAGNGGGVGGGDVGGSTSKLTSHGRTAAPGFDGSPAGYASGHPLMPPSTKQNTKSGVSELCAPQPQIGAANPPLVQFDSLEQLQPPSVGIGSSTGFAGGGGDGGAHGDADGGGDGDADGGTDGTGDGGAIGGANGGRGGGDGRGDGGDTGGGDGEGAARTVQQ